MKKSSLLLSLVLGLSLFVSCSDAMNTREEAAPSYEVTELAYGATFADFQLATESEHSSIDYYSLTLKDDSVYPADQKAFILTHKSRTVEFTDLKPDSDYILEVSYNLPSGLVQSFSRTYKFTTKPVYVPDFYFEYDSLNNCVIIKAEKENISNMCNRLTILRSTEIEGTYIEVGNDYLNKRTIDFVDNKDIEPKTTYFYKFKLFDAANALLAESEEPVLFNASKVVPEAVSKKTLKARTGLTSVSFTWEPVDFADYYEVEVSEDEDFEKVLEGCLKLEECSYTVKELLPEQKIYFRVFAVNDIGKSKEAPVIEAEIQEPKITDVSVLTGQSQVQYFVSTSFDKLEDNCSVVYTLRKSAKPDSELLVKNSFTEPVLSREGLIPETHYSSNSLGDFSAGYIHMVISCKNEDGSMQTFTSSRRVNDFYTDGYDAVTNLEVSSIRSTDALLSFTELTNEQKFGQTVNYALYAYCNGNNNTSDVNPLFAEADSSPIKITGLEPGRYYNFKLIATAVAGSQSDVLYKQFYAETEAATESGLSTPEIVSLSESPLAKDAEGKDLPSYKTALSLQWNKLPEEGAGLNLAYGIEYKIFEKSNFILAKKDIKADNDIFVVNAGNRYKVRLFAYEVENPECLSYSEVFEVQTKPLDDKNIANLTDAKFYEKGALPHSDLKNGYVLNFLSLEDTEYHSYKYSFDMSAAALSQVTPRLIYVDRSRISPLSNNYALIDELVVYVPESEIVLASFGKDKTLSDLNMPKFESRNDLLKSVDQMESAGLAVKDEWLFNNSVYISVKEKEAGDLGISYYY